MKHSLDIGKKLRGLRLGSRMTIRDVASKSGCAVSTVAQIELNQISPTVGSLEKICSAFDITVSDFLRVESFLPKPVFIPATREGCEVVMRWTGAKLIRVTNDQECSFTGLIYCLDPGSSTPSCHSLILKEQICFILKGQVLFQSDQGPFRLQTGEGFHFDPRHYHGWSNPGLVPAEVLVFNPYRFVLFEQREENLRWHLHVKRERRRQAKPRKLQELQIAAEIQNGLPMF